MQNVLTKEGFARAGVAKEGTLREDLSHFLQEHGDNRIKRELLLFWGKHPNATFTKFALCYAVDCGTLQADQALRAHMEAGLVEKYTNERGLPLYSLTSNADKRQPIVALAELDYGCWKIMLDYFHQI